MIQMDLKVVLNGDETFLVYLLCLKNVKSEVRCVAEKRVGPLDISEVWRGGGLWRLLRH